MPLQTRRWDEMAVEDVAPTNLAATSGRGGRHFKQTTTRRRRVDRRGRRSGQKPRRPRGTSWRKPPRSDVDAWDGRGGTSPWTRSQGRALSQRTWSRARERPTRCRCIGHRRLAGQTGFRGGGGRYSFPCCWHQHDGALFTYLPRQRKCGVTGGFATGQQCQGYDWRRRGYVVDDDNSWPLVPAASSAAEAEVSPP